MIKISTYAWVIVLLLTIGCAAPLKKSTEPDVFSSASADSALWRKLEGIRQDDWFHLLNTGQEALAWRIRAIDSASQSIDLQTFLWKSDSSGQLIMQRLLAAADRGSAIRILLDDSFLSGNHHDVTRPPTVPTRSIAKPCCSQAPSYMKPAPTRRTAASICSNR